MSRFAVKKTIQNLEYYFKGKGLWGTDIYGSSEEKQFTSRSEAETEAKRIGGRVVELAAWRWRY